MELYERKIFAELEQWQRKVTRKPSLTNRLARSVQQRVNKIIPEKAHQAITATIKQMVRAVLYGAKETTAILKDDISLQKREQMILEKIEFY